MAEFQHFLPLGRTIRFGIRIRTFSGTRRAQTTKGGAQNTRMRYVLFFHVLCASLDLSPIGMGGICMFENSSCLLVARR
jgi:hypothetical protein